MFKCLRGKLQLSMQKPLKKPPNNKTNCSECGELIRLKPTKKIRKSKVGWWQVGNKLLCKTCYYKLKGIK